MKSTSTVRCTQSTRSIVWNMIQICLSLRMRINAEMFFNRFAHEPRCFWIHCFYPSLHMVIRKYCVESAKTWTGVEKTFWNVERNTYWTTWPNDRLKCTENVYLLPVSCALRLILISDEHITVLTHIINRIECEIQTHIHTLGILKWIHI